MTIGRMRNQSFALVACLWVIVGAVAINGQSTTQRIWEGVYTAEQAERGKVVYTNTCIRCHGGDLTGTTAPALTGERFMANWSGETVERLFAKIRDTMPPTFGTVLDEAQNLQLVAFILQSSGYPSGPRELAANPELARIQILRKGEQATVQNFSLVQTVGCLERGSDNSWVLTKTAEPTVTRDDVGGGEALAAAATKPLGTQTYLLLSVAPFKPETQVGQKVEARGLVYREAGDARLTLTSLAAVGNCDL
jgi:cytochrome c5